MLGRISAITVAAVLTIGAVEGAAALGRSDAEPAAPAPQVAHRRSGPPHARPVDGTSQVLTVSVPASTFVRVDATGDIRSASTNTGRPPGPEDDVWAFWPDGTIEPASPELVAEVLRANWPGAWPGEGVWRRPLPRR